MSQENRMETIAQGSLESIKSHSVSPTSASQLTCGCVVLRPKRNNNFSTQGSWREHYGTYFNGAVLSGSVYFLFKSNTSNCKGTGILNDE